MTMRWRALAVAMTLSIAVAAPSAAQDSEFSITTIEMQLEAGSAFYDAWPSGTTIHSGVGYIRPYGAADYWCGVNYEEAQAYPDRLAQNAELLAHSRDGNPLFCIYRMEQGDIYALDVLVGNVERTGKGIERLDTVVNVVLGGSGAFAGASGIWVGTTAGRGEGSEVAEGITLPASILKLMDGYVRVPDSAGG